MCDVFLWMQKQTEKRTASNGKGVKKRRNNNDNKLLEPTSSKCVAEPASVGCPLMEEFDQFVQYQSMRKENEELIECQEAEIEFNIFGGIDKEVEEVAPNIITEDLGMSNNNENTPMDKNDENNYNVTESSSAVVLSLCKQDSVGENMCSVPLTTTKEAENICREVLSLAGYSECDYEGNSESEDSNEETVACVVNEEYVFPTPEEAYNASTPEIDKVFSTLEDASRFENVYAELNGFTMIKRRNYKNKKLYFSATKVGKDEVSTLVLGKGKETLLKEQIVQ